MTWSPSQYLNFEDDRTRPVRDLLAAVPNRGVRTAIDLGCGPGNSTEVLIARYPGAQVSALDSSPEMIAAARKRLPGIPLETVGLEHWSGPETYDVILSNAVLQWLPDHDRLLPRLMSRLAPGGSLAVQLPDNLDEPAQVLMRDVAASGPWAAKLAKAADARPRMNGPGWYYDVLRPHARRVDVWMTTYQHVLAGVDAIVDWFQGSGLRPFLAPLNEEERAGYLAEYRAGIARTHPPRVDGTVLLPFPRFFFVATR